MRKLSITGLSQEQIDWIRKEAERLSIAKTAVVKILIQEALENENSNKEEQWRK